MKTKNLIFTFTFLVALYSCFKTTNFSQEHGFISSDRIERIEYYDGLNYLMADSLKKPESTVTNQNKIAEIVNEINYSKFPVQGKGSSWDKIVIVKSDTVITLSTNGEIVGTYTGNGTFFKFKDKDFIKDIFLLKK